MKRIDRVVGAGDEGDFPSPKGGGPIEAGAVLICAKRWLKTFPSPKGGGPIEALFHVVDGGFTAR